MRERPGTSRTVEALRQEIASRGMGQMDVSPHEFKPIQRFRNRGRCVHCLVHEADHPAVGWLPSRPMFDKSEAIRLA